MSNPRLESVILQQRTPTPSEVAAYKGLRQDGTPKGPGFYGEVSEHDSPELYATELPYTVIQFDGGMQTFPIIVPGMSYEALAHVVTGGRPTPAMIRWANEHADARARRGLSPFAQLGEQYQLPEPRTPPVRLTDEEDAHAID